MNQEAIRKYCLSLPQVTEDLKWQVDLCFLVAGKMFCIIQLDSEFACSFKVDKEEFQELTARDGIISAPYFGRAGWVRVEESMALGNEEFKQRIRHSYDLIVAKLTRKVRHELGL